jgi:hypothetical protein
MITNSAIQSVLNAIDLQIQSIAVGSGTAPTDPSATSLTSESYSKDITLRLRDGNIQVVEVFFDETEANGTITELGAKKTDGDMFNIEAANITKDNTQSLTVSIEIEVMEVK